MVMKGKSKYRNDKKISRMQMLQAFELDIMRCFIGQIGRRRTGARAEDETERCIETDVVNQLHQFAEVFFGFAGKTDDEIRAH